MPELADCDPLDAYVALRAKERGPLMIASEGAHPEARATVIGFDPALDVLVRGDATSIVRNGHAQTRHGHPLGVLRDLMDAHHYPVEETHFTGGWMGYFGYEAAALFDPTLPGPKQPPATPDVALRLCRSALVFDHAAGEVFLYAADLLGSSDAAEERLLTAHQLLRAAPPHVTDDETGSPEWESSLDARQFGREVERIRGLIEEGDLFQANIATRFSTQLNADPAALFERLRDANPSPYMAVLEIARHGVASGSPELLVAVEDGIVRSRPIAGTRPRGVDEAEDARMEAELLSDSKEDAEHRMLVDLVRNDVSRVALPGSVHVPESKSVERYRHVMHLVSRVEGAVRPDAHPLDVLAALFPGGTITGAPKHRACVRIHESEPVPRGPYTGSAGFISWSRRQVWNILIRTLVVQQGQAAVHAGSGIVADSDPEREWQEAGHKARALLEAATGRDPGTGNRGRIGSVTRTSSWTPPRPPRAFENRRVLVVDNVDSFVHNLADYAAALGADVKVVRNDVDVESIRAWHPTHIILSPGPGHPADSRVSLELAKNPPCPVLGVCLGHQAIGLAHGASIVRSRPVHGKLDTVQHRDTGLLQGCDHPIAVARYHSLSVAELPDGWHVDGHLADGTVMAMRHPQLPLFGLQFHPESVGTPQGMQILARFLEVE